MKIKTSIAVGLTIILISVISILLIPESKAQRNQDFVQTEIPTYVEQLKVSRGKIPVTLKCDDAELESSYKLEKLNCYATNNTDKSIMSLVMTYRLSMERDGKPESFSNAVTIEILLEPSLYEINKKYFIFPGSNNPINVLPTAFEESVVIKEVNVQIDYVEFDDYSTINENGEGADLVKEFRVGFAKYKDWFAEEFKNSEQSETKLKQLFQDVKLAKEKNLVDINSKQFTGANIFQKFIRRIYTTEGVMGVKKVLSPDKRGNHEN